MNCRTPGCNTTIPDVDHERRFCERCGWPLSLGLVSTRPEVLSFRGDLPATVEVCVHNQGTGTLRWRVQEVPKGVVAATDDREVVGNTEGRVGMTIDPKVVKEDTIRVVVRLWDRVGGSSVDLRPPEVDACWRDEAVDLRVRRERHGPILSKTKSVVFGGTVSASPVKIENGGETTLNVRATVSDGYYIQVPGQAKATAIDEKVTGGTSWTLTVGRHDPKTTTPGKLTVTSEDLDPVEVVIVPVPVRPPQPPKERWVVAIDFGTNKSAVMVLEQKRRGAEPQPVTWEKQVGQAMWLPSAVELDKSTGEPIRYGWDVPNTIQDNILRSLKMRLREDTDNAEGERVRACVVYFLRRLLERTASQFEGVFDSARVTFTLPVLDNGEQYEKQRQRTLQYALEAGRGYGLREDQIDFYKEPECAAVDFLHMMQTGPNGDKLPQNQWLCVLDMGGGTTDVTFALLNVLTSGMPTFDEVHSLGYENMAGDHIDNEIYGWIVERWKENSRVKEPPESTPLPDIKMAKQVSLKGEPLALVRRQQVGQSQLIKENMFSTTPPTNQKYEATRSENEVVVTPEGLAPTLKIMADTIFITGLESGGKTLPSVQRGLDKLSISPDRIKFLCITGGTSLIPDFEANLKKRVLTNRNMQTLVDREFIRLNVVRGAARRPAMVIQGLLPCDVSVTWDMEAETGLPTGTVPGATKTLEKHVLQGHTINVGLRLHFPDRESIILFSCPITNDADDIDQYGGLTLQAILQYQPQGILRLQIVWNSEHNLPEPLPTQVVQQLPCY